MINAESENVNTFFMFPAFLLKMTNLRGSQTSKNAGTPVKWALNIHNKCVIPHLPQPILQRHCHLQGGFDPHDHRIVVSLFPYLYRIAHVLELLL